MSSRGRWAWVTLGLVLAAGLSLVFRLAFPEFVRQQIIIPLQYLLWLGGLISRSVGQVVCWDLLALAAGILLIRLLWNLGFFYAPAPKQRGAARSGRIRYWEALLRRSRDGSFSDAYAREELRRLAQNILAYRERVNPDDLEPRLQERAEDIPPEILALLRSNREADRRRPPARQPLGFFKKTEPGEFEKDLNTILGYLEKQMEIEHDLHNP